MVPTLSYMNVSISIALVLVHKCIVYQQIVEICCEVLTFYCCNVYISLSISELQEHASSYCSLLWYTKGTVYQQNYHKIGAKSLNSTRLQSFVHFCIQVIELQELACRIVMCGPKLFLWFFKNGDVYTNFTMPIVCASPNSITSPSFRCWSIPVSEIREFNRKKKKKNSKSGYFQFYTFPTVPFLNQT